jgi:protein tyrosine/serine phosphatase
MRHWQTIVDCGVRTIIELRDKDHSDRLCKMCETYSISYFAFPLDSHSVPDEVIASRLKEFFELVDNGDFYIACAMGLHRTDMALAIYWMFHGADNGIDPPILRGHIADGELVLGRLNNKVFRRLNSLYAYLMENNVIPIPDRETFAQRKKDLIDFNRRHISIV